MSNNSNLATGIVVGGAIGAGAGAFAGIKKAGKFLSQYGITKTGKVGSDEFVKNQAQYIKTRLAANEGKISETIRASKMAEAFQKIGKKAGEDFVTIAKKAANTKTKWIAGLAVAGAAVGAAVKAIANKNKTNEK